MKGWGRGREGEGEGEGEGGRERERWMRKGKSGVHTYSLKANPISSSDCHARPTCARRIASENGCPSIYVSRVVRLRRTRRCWGRKGVGGRGGGRTFCRARAFLEIAIPQFRGGTCLACFLPRRLRNYFKEGSIL